jgi:chromosome segregation ATPase
LALPGKSLQSGWQQQAARLVATHTANGTTVVAAAEHARRSRLLNRDMAEIDVAGKTRETELAKELEFARAKIAGLERRMAHETATALALGEQLQVVTAQSEVADNRLVELETAHEELVRRDIENRSNQTSLELTIGELSRRLAEKDAALDQARAGREYLESALSAAEAECTRLTRDVIERGEKRRAELHTLNVDLEAMTSRAVTAETLLADSRECLLARVTESEAAERRLADATVACKEADGQIKKLQDAFRLQQRRVEDLERARLQLIEAADMLRNSLQTRDTALIRAEEKIKFLNKRITQLETEAIRGESRSEAEIVGSGPQCERVDRPHAEDEREQDRRRWAELARELPRLVLLKHSRRHSEEPPMRATAALLESTIAF